MIAYARLLEGHHLEWTPGDVEDEDSGDNVEDWSRLSASIEIEGLGMFHMTAIEVEESDGIQMAVDGSHQTEFDSWALASADEGQYSTTEIKGPDGKERSYAVFFSPFC